MRQVDITTDKDFKSTQVAIFGLKLGLTVKQAEQIWNANDSLVAKYDNLTSDGSTRYYIYDKNSAGEAQNCLIYAIWNKGDTTLARITFFTEMYKYLKGKTRRMLSFDAIDKNSELSKSFLGKPDKVEVTLDIPDIDFRHKMYYFYKMGLEIGEITDERDHRIVFALVPPRP